MTEPDPALLAEIDRAQAAVAHNRADAPQARAEHRCAAEPEGCGQPLPRHISVAFRDRASRAEYDLTGLCQDCQDRYWPGPSDEEAREMAADEYHYGRCGECGQFRPYEFVDVGVGVIKGFDCCRPELDGADRAPRCAATNEHGQCFLGADHFHWHDFPDPNARPFMVMTPPRGEFDDDAPF